MLFAMEGVDTPTAVKGGVSDMMQLSAVRKKHGNNSSLVEGALRLSIGERLRRDREGRLGKT